VKSSFCVNINLQGVRKAKTKRVSKARHRGRDVQNVKLEFGHLSGDVTPASSALLTGDNSYLFVTYDSRGYAVECFVMMKMNDYGTRPSYYS
jgi:hypothetical protein